jgi:hypothetical protein
LTIVARITLLAATAIRIGISNTGTIIQTR